MELAESLLSSALWATIAQAGRAGHSVLLSRRDSRSIASSMAAVRKRLNKAGTEAARFAEIELGDEGLARFLETPECCSLVVQMFEAQLGGPDAELQGQISRKFRVQVERYSEVDSGLVDRLFVSLWGAADKALETAIDEGVLSAHEARSLARHESIRDQLASLERGDRVTLMFRQP